MSNQEFILTLLALIIIVAFTYYFATKGKHVKLITPLFSLEIN